MQAAAYYRTSSRTNVGFDKDSLSRQQNAVSQYAKANGIQIVREYYDEAVSGADSIDVRDGFSSMLAEMKTTGATAILVESASRFARDLSVQILGHQKLQELGFDLIAVDSPSAFTDDTPTAELVRSLLGAVSSFERATVVARLKSGRERKKKLTGKGQGRRSLTEVFPDLSVKAKRLRRKSPKTGKRLSYDKVAEALFAAGYATSKGNRYSASTVKSLVVQ
jgi:DNA invertase Pin-like site-specific DNA recombinase|tara:strand:+ start:24 stop:689 length:666 start_codon:yes stop_codon:yes gene_type:complete